MGFDNPSPFGETNPYAGSASVSATRPEPKRPYPVLCMVVFIMNLVFCLLRTPMVLLGFIGYSALKAQQDPMLVTAVYEIGTGIAIVLFGLLANGLMLARQRAGIPFAWLHLVAVLGSMGVGVWQAIFMLNGFEPGSPERMGAMGGLVITFVIRVVLVGLYVTAITMFSRWVRAQRTAQF